MNFSNEQPKTEDEMLGLRVVKHGAMVNDRELEERMRKAAEGKEKINGVMRRPDETYRP